MLDSAIGPSLLELEIWARILSAPILQLFVLKLPSG